MKKKILIVLSAFVVLFGLCSCGTNGGSLDGNSAKSIPEINPALLITAEDVAAYAGYTPVVEESETLREDNVATVLYRSEPVGQNDVVKVKVTQFTDKITQEQISEQYENEKAKRSSAELVSGLGQEAYIAYPSIRVYDRGCIIEITAGSGSDETQKALLTSLANVAAGRLEKMVSEN